MAKTQSDDIEIRVSLLEHTVIAQNAATNETLRRIESVLREVHDKQDTSILNTSVKITEIDGKIALVEQKAEQTNSKVNKFFGGILALILAIVGGIASIPEIFTKK